MVALFYLDRLFLLALCDAGVILGTCVRQTEHRPGQAAGGATSSWDRIGS